MSLWKRGANYWTDFSIEGERFRLPLGTTDEREAKGLEKVRTKEAMEGRIRSKVVPLSKLPLDDAIAPYLADKKPHVAPNTWISEKERLNQVRKVIGEKPVRKINRDTIKQYIAHRLQAGRSGKTINLEIGALRRLMKEAGVWRRIGDAIKPLPQRSTVGRALEKDEKTRLLEVASSSEKWVWARLAAILALGTTMRSCEIRGLQWQHVDLLDKSLAVRRQTTKTDAGERRLPLNANALAAILELRELSKQLFGDNLQPAWYVFPSRVASAHPDPTRPMLGWRTAWRKMTKKAQLPGFRFHDLRHTTITMLEEGQGSESTVLAIAGHVSRKMLDYYSHIRMAAKRAALDALCETPRAGQDATPEPVTSQNHVTNETHKTLSN